MTASYTTLKMGAVAYAPKVITIWEGFRAYFAERGFGDLDPAGTMRAMIVATTTLVAGTQLALTAFMSSVINIPLLEQRARPQTDSAGPQG